MYVYQSFQLHFCFSLQCHFYYTVVVIVYRILLQYPTFSSHALSCGCDLCTKLTLIPFHLHKWYTYIYTQAKATNRLISNSLHV